MKRVAIISLNGTRNMGGVERVVAQHAELLREVAQVRIFSLAATGWIGAIRRSKLGNLFSCCVFSLFSSIPARLWAGRKGSVMSHGYGSIGAFCDLLFAHGCWAGYSRQTGTRSGPFGRFIYGAEWLGAHLAKRVVGVSENVIEEWVRFYGLARSRAGVQLNAVDTSIFSPRGEASQPCSGSTIRVLFVGRFESGKGTAYLAQLHEQLRSADKAWDVLICSPTEIPEEVRTRYRRFRFASGLRAEEIAGEYNQADLFLLPSQYEGFELSTLEALACGTPVLLNNTGSRPTLEKLSCPGVFRLEDAESPLDALIAARESFRGLCRSELARWAQSHFDRGAIRTGLLALCNGSVEPV